jgi:DMSO/TMAO reductase YedYZ molybdopterin-dependent catalytic subunit
MIFMDEKRRRFLQGVTLGAGVFGLTGCRGLSQTEWWPKVLASAERLTKGAQRLVAGSWALAPEYTKADIAPEFRANGTLNPGTPNYNAMAAIGFHDWRIEVGGLVEQPLHLSMTERRSMPSRTQITRHDCVEGWSCIGEWTGTPLRLVLAQARPRPNANYVVFYCADPMSTDLSGNSSYYYESLDLVEACHPQTLLAYQLNGQDLPVPHGAPVRLRAERQLGYKQAKYVQRLELVENFENINGGKGGYWEDLGYSWWGGI